MIEAGNNYGWILVTHGAHYNGDPVVRGAGRVPGMTEPALLLGAVDNPGNIAFYSADSSRLARRPAARDDVALARAHRFRRRRQDRAVKKRLLTDLGQRLRDVRQGPDGFVYVLTDETAGAVLKIEP